MSLSSDRRAVRQTLALHALLTIPDVAGILGCSVDVAREMIDRKEIPSVAVGRRKHVDPQDVVAYILAQRDGVSVEEFWAEGDVALERIRAYLNRVRRIAS